MQIGRSQVRTPSGRPKPPKHPAQLSPVSRPQSLRLLVHSPDQPPTAFLLQIRKQLIFLTLRPQQGGLSVFHHYGRGRPRPDGFQAVRRESPSICGQCACLLRRLNRRLPECRDRAGSYPALTRLGSRQNRALPSRVFLQNSYLDPSAHSRMMLPNV